MLSGKTLLRGSWRGPEWLPPRMPRARPPRRCSFCHASIALSYGALTARTAAGALQGTAAKWNLSAAVNMLAVLGAINPTTAAVAHSAAAAAAAHGGSAAHAAGLSTVMLVLAGLGPLGGAIYVLLRQIYHRMEPYILKSDGEASAKEQLVLYGVDVTGSDFLTRPAVRRAVEFAAAAHAGQVRKTGEPYVAHCIETALIVEDLLSATEDELRAEAAVIAAVLHDVCDDTSVGLAEVEAKFGEQISSMVSKVSQLSQTNQLVRRRLRLENAQPTREDERKLELLILTMVTEPLVIVIKLADRLHNMRTVYALPPDKQQAVAQETRKVWCTLAERLGIFSVKSELEDLCFAVLQPVEFRALRDAVFQYCGIQPISPSELRLDAALSMSSSSASYSLSSMDESSSLSSLMSSIDGDDLAVRYASALGSASALAAAPSASSAASSLLTPQPHSTAATSAGNTLGGGQQHSSSGSGGSSGGGSSVLGGAAAAAAAAALATGPSHAAHAATISGGSSSSSILCPWPRPDPLDALPHHRPPPDSLIEAAPSSRHHPSAGLAPQQHLAAAVLASSAREAAAAAGGSGGSGQEPGSIEALGARLQAAAGGDAGEALVSGDAWLSPEQQQVRELLESVLPFHASTFNMDKLHMNSNARRGLEVLKQCAKLLMREIRTEGYASGLEVSVQGRVKSLYSIFKKMTRKRVPVSQVYDARALRVVVHDADGLLQREAIAACYKLLPAVHRLWRKIPGEEDDYMVTPKPSGYQSLHTAVMGPGGVPMEVQIRTSSMHEDAEYGKAAHWAYKERPANPGAPGISKPHEIVAGDPLLQMGAAGRVRQGVVLEVQQEGLRLLVAVSNDPGQPTAAGLTRPPSPEECSLLVEHVMEREWWAPGLGDHTVAVELYGLCADGKYHRLDHLGARQSTFVIPTKHSPAGPEAEAGRGAPEHGGSMQGGDVEYMHNRIRLLRSMLEWRQEDISSGAGGGAQAGGRESVIVLVWPQGSFLLLPKGTTAGEVVRMHDEQASSSSVGGTVIVNNRPVDSGTPLDDGDYVVLSQEVLQI